MEGCSLLSLRSRRHVKQCLTAAGKLGREKKKQCQCSGGEGGVRAGNDVGSGTNVFVCALKLYEDKVGACSEE